MKMAGEVGGVWCQTRHLFVVLEELHDGIHGKGKNCFPSLPLSLLFYEGVGSGGAGGYIRGWWSCSTA
jgi:hypothetical protein